MSSSQPVFSVLLDREAGEEEAPGLQTDAYSLYGAPFFRSGKCGLAESIEALQNAGLVQAPMYLLVNGRVKDSGSRIFADWFDGFGERWRLDVERNYKGVRRGKYVVDIQNGGFFMPRPWVIRDAISFSETPERFTDTGVPIQFDDKALLLGEHMVYKRNDGKVEAVPVDHFFRSYEEFLEASAQPGFLDDLPTYVVLRELDEARRASSGYRMLFVQKKNPDLVIPAGGLEQLAQLLEKAAKLGWKYFGSRHNGYAHPDHGRVPMIGYLDSRVENGSILGNSVGIDPQALESAGRKRKGVGIGSKRVLRAVA